MGQQPVWVRIQRWCLSFPWCLSASYRRRVSQPCRLDNDSIELQPRLDPHHQFLENCDKILTNSAADAPVHHLDNLLLSLHFRVLGQQRIINAHRAELVLNNSQLLPMRRSKDMVEKRGLTTSQKSREHRHGHTAVGNCRVAAHGFVVVCSRSSSRSSSLNGVGRCVYMYLSGGVCKVANAWVRGWFTVNTRLFAAPPSAYFQDAKALG
jgi:hypothetical protein